MLSAIKHTACVAGFACPPRGAPRSVQEVAKKEKEKAQRARAAAKKDKV